MEKVLMNRTTKTTKGCGNISSNGTLFDGIWFRGVKIADGGGQ